MSVPCEEIRPELEALLGAMTEGQLDGDGRKRLAAILHDHPDARQYYVEYCQMHALLKSAHGELHAMQLPSRAPWKLLAAAAAMVVAALVYMARTSAPVKVEAQLAPVAGTSWVVRDGRRLSPSEAGPMVDGDRRLTGPLSELTVKAKDGTTLLLREGTQSRFGTGADGRLRVELEEGLLRVDAAPQKAGHPLIFATRHAEATIVGTIFDLATSGNETRLQLAEGRVRLSAAGKTLELKSGEIAVADRQGLLRWVPVCDYSFAGMKALPATMETVFCPSETLHTPQRKVEAAPERAHFEPGGLVLGPATPPKTHGLVVTRWKEEVGDDLLMEVDVAGGERWSLGFSMSGDSFEGFRTIFAVQGYPNGVAIDTIHPIECVVLASDPRTISYEKDHLLRVERRAGRMRVWIDRELLLDTEIRHPLPETRRRTFAISNYGAPPVLRGLRVWKPEAP